MHIPKKNFWCLGDISLDPLDRLEIISQSRTKLYRKLFYSENISKI